MIDRDPTTREIQIQLQALDRLILERLNSIDRRVELAAEQRRLMDEKLANQTREDKAAANEWRGALRDTLSKGEGRTSGISSSWAVVIAVLMAGIALFATMRR